MLPKTCSAAECERPIKAQSFCNMHYQRLMKHGNATTVLSSHKTASVRFWANVNKSESCWEWTGHITENGYGRFSVDRRMTLAHRFIYESTIGQVASGMDIDHMCHNRPCVNPAHLREVTRKQNNENRLGAQVNNRSGVRGVSWSEEKQKWTAMVVHNGERIHLGSFQSVAKAGAAAKALRNKLFTHNDLDRIPA